MKSDAFYEIRREIPDTCSQVEFFDLDDFDKARDKFHTWKYGYEQIDLTVKLLFVTKTELLA